MIDERQKEIFKNSVKPKKSEVEFMKGAEHSDRKIKELPRV